MKNKGANDLNKDVICSLIKPSEEITLSTKTALWLATDDRKRGTKKRTQC